MNGTPLRRAELNTALTGREIDLALAERKTAPRHRPIEYAAFAALACAIVIASFVAAPGRSGLFGGALGILMLAVAVADARAFIIPDNLTIAAFLLALTNAANEGLASMPENIAAAALRGLVLALAFFALRESYLRLRHRHGIGLGDVKLAAVAGAWLDWTLVPVAIEIAALTALSIYVASHLVRRRPLCAAAQLPFGLFFAPAIWFCWLFNAMFLEF
ncbi:MAG TPA: A24 family peptidase [Methylocella sp.]|nr:A24 family peptidase [Methylocella sp.]